MSIIIKNEEQITGIRKSCQLAAATLRFIEQFIEVGRSTEDINQKAEVYIRAHGAMPAPLGYKGFPKATCISLNEVICHGIPNEKTILKEGDIVKVDISTILDGYYGDTCKTFSVGKISDKAQQLINATKECLNLGIAQIKQDNEFWMISKAITDYAVSRGFSVIELYGGHGLGEKFHEPPFISHYYNGNNLNKEKMQYGYIFTVEPMICEKKSGVLVLDDRWTAVTVDNGLCAQFEHAVLVTELGYEILTI